MVAKDKFIRQLNLVGSFSSHSTRIKEVETNRKISFEMIFNKYFDDVSTKGMMIYLWQNANAHVACVIPSTGYNKTIENISDSNVNLQ